MQKESWRKALENCADPKRAEQFLRLLQSTEAGPRLRKVIAEEARILSALLSGSQVLAELAVKRPDWFISLIKPGLLQQPRLKEHLQSDLERIVNSTPNFPGGESIYAEIRMFKQREWLRVATRDLARLASVSEIIAELSDIADVCLAAFCEQCQTQLALRFGWPYHRDERGRWHSTQFSMIGLGKLGGNELNYSSDVDVILVYSEEGKTFKEPPRSSESTGRGLSNHQFFLRFAEILIAEITRLTAEGSLFRIDLRLRPEGKAGPMVRSLSSYETYYAQWGQTWERMMLIKARPVAGNSELGAEFLEMIQAFRYPRSLSQGVLREMARMKDRIEAEIVRSGEIDRNVKLGRGGIREIEFVTQTLQLLHAGRNPFLQDSSTLSALEKITRYKLLPLSATQALSQAYCWLRDIEHRLQMENQLQTHTIPVERRARDRLSRLMGFESLTEFEQTHLRHTNNVRKTYEMLLKSDESPPECPMPDLESNRGDWLKLLEAHSFRDSERAYTLLHEFVYGPGYVHVSPRTAELAFRLLPGMLKFCPTQELKAQGVRFEKPMLSDPDRVLARLDRFISAYGARATLYELWTNNPALFHLLLLLFDRSEFLAETAIRTPDLVDELELSGRLRRSKTTEETLRDLRHGSGDLDQRLWIRRYQQAELMRIGLRDILGLADFEQNLVELSALADACLIYALETVLRKQCCKSQPLTIIGFGKLGGRELCYGSDLDITFVTDAKVKVLPQLQRIAVGMIEILSAQTELGVAFQIDARLRPDGENGLLVNTLSAYEDYYLHRAQLWELQALSRARAIGGNAELGATFEANAKRLTNFANPVSPPSAFSPHWKEEIARMRQRIELERTPPGKQDYAIKTGRGGLIDAEFIAQTLCLENGWHEPNTLRALIRSREQQVLSKPEADSLIDNYLRLRRIEGILRRWSYMGETVLPEDPAPLTRVSVRCGFISSEEFLKSTLECRTAIRKVYSRLLPLNG